MKRSLSYLLKSTVIISLLLAANASAQNKDNDFAKIDEMIAGLERLSEIPSESTTPVAADNLTTGQPNAQSNIGAELNANVEVVEKVVQPTPEKRVTGSLTTRLTELPPGSRFEFSNNTFIPANKKGILFVNGEAAYSVESIVDPLSVLMARSDSESGCILISDHSYLMMRGSNHANGKPPSFLDVDNVEFMKGKSSGVESLMVKVNFKGKPVSSMSDKMISMYAACKISEDMRATMKQYTLGDLNKGFGGLFSFKLPRYIEI